MRPSSPAIRIPARRTCSARARNLVECQQEDPETEFARCYNTVLVPRNDLTAKLRAEGKSGEEIQAAIAAAIEAGDIPETPSGTMSY